MPSHSKAPWRICLNLWQALEAAITDGIANQVECELVAAAKDRLHELHQKGEQDLLRQKAAEELSAAAAKQDIGALAASLSKAEACGVAEKASKRCLATHCHTQFKGI